MRLSIVLDFLSSNRWKIDFRWRLECNPSLSSRDQMSVVFTFVANKNGEFGRTEEGYKKNHRQFSDVPNQLVNARYCIL